MLSTPARWPNSTWSEFVVHASLLSLLAGCVSVSSVMVVSSPLIDVRSQPRTIAQRDVHDPAEETQLLYGERVRVVKTAEDWVQIEALEQPEYTQHNQWQGYSGWIPRNTLIPWRATWQPTIVVTDRWAMTWRDADAQHPSPWRFPLGTRVKATDVHGPLWKVELLDGTIIWMPHGAAHALAQLQHLPIDEKRRAIVRSAQELLGDLYYWGGRSPSASAPTEAATGVDCSGLVNLAYRTAGLTLPRDAHEQFLRARRTRKLQPADLIFLSERQNPRHMAHVMLYAGNGEVIEGPGTGLNIRRISVAERLGRPLEQLKPGTIVDGQTVFFGTYLP